MLIKALTAGALVVAATAADALTIPRGFSHPVMSEPMVRADPTSFTTPPRATPPAATDRARPRIVSSIPEPAAWMLSIAGFGLVGLVRRARVRRVAA